MYSKVYSCTNYLWDHLVLMIIESAKDFVAAATSLKQLHFCVRHQDSVLILAAKVSVVCAFW